MKMYSPTSIIFPSGVALREYDTRSIAALPVSKQEVTYMHKFLFAVNLFHLIQPQALVARIYLPPFLTFLWKKRWNSNEILLFFVFFLSRFVFYGFSLIQIVFLLRTFLLIR
jgi:hypothetical protein